MTFFFCWYLVFDRCLTQDYYSASPIDFEQQPIEVESLTQQDIIVKLSFSNWRLTFFFLRFVC